MNPVDLQIIARKAKLILEDLVRLEEYAKNPLETYLAKYELQLASERLLELILSRLIDINYHILSQKHKMIPSDYADSFVKMQKMGEITEELFGQMKGAAGLRNALAHEYDQIDPKMVYEGMQNTIKYVRGYLKQVVSESF